MKHCKARVMELVDVVDSKSTGGDTVPVRVRPRALRKKTDNDNCLLFSYNAYVIREDGR